MEVIRLFENLIAEIEPIHAKDILYEKYKGATKEVLAKLCFSDAESCI